MTVNLTICCHHEAARKTAPETNEPMYTWFKLSSSNDVNPPPHPHTHTHNPFIPPNIKLTSTEPSIQKYLWISITVMRYMLLNMVLILNAGRFAQPTFRAGISTVSLMAKEPWRTVPVMTVPWPRMEKQWSTAISRSPPGSLLGRYVCFFKSWDAQSEVQNSVGNVDTQKEYHTYPHSRLALLGVSWLGSNFLTVFTGDWAIPKKLQ